MQIDPRSHVPIYLQIVEQVRGAIAAGVFRAGEALPTQRALALSLGVNPNTVQKAFDELERRELAVSRRGVGMFVADRGAAAAQNHTTATIGDIFRRGVAVARDANVSREQTEEIFRKIVRQEFSRIRETR